MGFDWFTLFAQIVNFLILVFLLKYFLYHRIINAMDKREENILARMNEAEEKRKEAEKEAEAHREQRHRLEEEREKLFDQAKQEAEEKRKELIETARGEAEGLRLKWNQSIDQEKDAFLKDLRHRAGEQIHQAVRRALTDLADRDLEQHMIDVFISRLQDLDKEEEEAIADALRESDDSVVITSTFEIPEEKRLEIRNLVRRELHDAADVRFETSHDSICGIVLQAGGHKIAWNFEAYVEELEEAVAHIFEREAEEGKPSEKKT